MTEQQATLRVLEPVRRHGKKPFGAPKGHEAFLKALESSGATVKFVLISSGAEVVGTIKTSDKYTVSVAESQEDGRYLTRVLFKHDISEFQPLIPAPAGVQ